VAKKKPPLPHLLPLLHPHQLLTHLPPLLLLTHLRLPLLPLAKRSNSFHRTQKSHLRVAFLCLNRPAWGGKMAI